MTSDQSATDSADATAKPDDDDLSQVYGTAASLSPKISLKVLGAPHLILTLVLAIVFLIANYLPLRGADLWLHVLHGEWILDHGRLPTSEPFMPFSEGMRLIDSQWLSQLLFASVERLAGPEMLSTLFALLSLAAHGALARAIYVRTNSVAAAAGGVVLFLVVGWSRLGAIRPEILGLVCFASLLWLLAEACRREEKGGGFGLIAWLTAPLLLALWANLHGSFACGLVVLGCFAAGELIRSVWERRSLSGVLSDERLRRRVVLFELCLVATLLNPYGVDLLLYTVWFSGNENLQEVLEWQPMVISGPGGRSFVFAITLLIILMRRSRAPLSISEGLALLAFGIASLVGIRMLSWFAPLYAFVTAPHLLDVLRQVWPARGADEEAVEPDPTKPPPGRSFHYSLASLVAIWVAFALSPSATPLMGGPPRTPTQLFGDTTPIGLSEHLKERPVNGPILGPQEWSDWLIYAGSTDDNEVKPFVTSNIHMAPRQVWIDYMAMISNRSSWDGMLERYRIAGVALDKTRHQNQMRAMRKNVDWRQTYEDRTTVFFRPREAAPTDSPKKVALTVR